MSLPEEINFQTAGGPIVPAAPQLVTNFRGLTLPANTYVQMEWLWYSGAGTGFTLELVFAESLAAAIAGAEDSEQVYLSTATPQSFYRPCIAVPTVLGSFAHQLYVRQMTDPGRPRVRLAWRIREVP